MDIDLHYAEPLVRKAVRRYCFRKVGWIFFIALALLLAAFVLRLLRRDGSWAYVGLLFGSPVLAFVWLYGSQLATALGKFRALAGKPFQFHATDSSFSFQSLLGSEELPWRALEEVWQYEDLWILVRSKNRFMTFPLNGVPQEVRNFLLERVTP